MVRLDAATGDERVGPLRHRLRRHVGQLAHLVAPTPHGQDVIPLGASIPLGAYAFDRAIDELLIQLNEPPALIVVSTSSGGTQAGLLAGCLRRGLPTRVLGISADDPAAALVSTVRQLLAGLDATWNDGLDRAARAIVDVDDTQVGTGYGIPTTASEDATRTFARLEGLILDPTYTAKAAAGLLAHLRAHPPTTDAPIVFWHTGGLPGVFA